MPTYEINVRAVMNDSYIIIADSLEDAKTNWYEGTLIYSEALEEDIVDINEVEETNG